MAERTILTMEQEPSSPSPSPSPSSARSTSARRGGEPTARLTTPPTHSRRGNWLLLLLCGLIALPAMVMELHQPAVYDADEAAALRRSMDTWNYYLAQRGGEDEHEQWTMRVLADRLVPYRGTVPQLEDPPAMAWLHEAAFLSLGRHAIDDPDTMRAAVLRARGVSVLFGLLTIAAVFWAGYSLGGTRTAAFAALIAAANVVLIHYARLAAAPVIYSGFAMLAVAAGMWAMRPLRPHASVPRQVIGWMICGIALGAATLIAGPTAGPPITFPMIVMVLLCPHRVSNLLGLVAAHAIAALVLVPWALQVHEHNPDIWEAWLSQLWPAELSLGALLAQMRSRAFIALLILLPWTLWLIGALTQPFSASSAGARQRPFIAMGWFLTTALVLVIMPQPQTTLAQSNGQAWLSHMAAMLLLAPVAAVFIGQLFDQYAQLAAAGRYPRIWRLLRWPHLTLLAAASLLAVTLGHTQYWMIDQGWLHQPIVAAWSWPFWAGLGVALAIVLALSVRYALKEFPARAMVCWAMWSIVLAMVMCIPMTRSDAMQRSAMPDVAAGPLTQMQSSSMPLALREP